MYRHRISSGSNNIRGNRRDLGLSLATGLSAQTPRLKHVRSRHGSGSALSKPAATRTLGGNAAHQSGRGTQLAGLAALPLTLSGTGLRSTSLVEDTVRQNMTYPGLTADINDWAFKVSTWPSSTA